MELRLTRRVGREKEESRGGKMVVYWGWECGGSELLIYEQENIRVKMGLGCGSGVEHVRAERCVISLEMRH